MSAIIHNRAVRSNPNRLSSSPSSIGNQSTITVTSPEYRKIFLTLHLGAGRTLTGGDRNPLLKRIGGMKRWPQHRLTRQPWIAASKHVWRRSAPLQSAQTHAFRVNNPGIWLNVFACVSIAQIYVGPALHCLAVNHGLHSRHAVCAPMPAKRAQLSATNIRRWTAQCASVLRPAGDAQKAAVKWLPEL